MARPLSSSLPGARRVLFAIVRPFEAFLRLEAASGILLMGSAAVAIVVANTSLAEHLARLVALPVTLRAGELHASWPLQRWVNDVLMTAFFLVAGMEIKRELVLGELRTPARVALPLVAALGGMAVPALIYLAIARGSPALPGWGVPTATDIAFALGVLSLVRRRVPSSLFTFLTALAIFDDLGAIVVIALFYGGAVHAGALALSVAIIAAMRLAARMKLQSLPPYLILGGALWFALEHAGLHPTLAGVALGLSLPAVPNRAPALVLKDLDDAFGQLHASDPEAPPDPSTLAAIEAHLEAMQAPLARMTRGLHAPVAFAVVPLFALLNAGVRVELASVTRSPAAAGAFFGLVIGKPVGVMLATWLCVRSGLAPMPTGARWRDILGVSVLAGIGFTMSLFVTALAFGGDRALEDAARAGVLGGSLVAALAGVALVRAFGRVRAEHEPIEQRVSVPDVEAPADPE